MDSNDARMHSDHPRERMPSNPGVTGALFARLSESDQQRYIAGLARLGYSDHEIAALIELSVTDVRRTLGRGVQP